MFFVHGHLTTNNEQRTKNLLSYGNDIGSLVNIYFKSSSSKDRPAPAKALDLFEFAKSSTPAFINRLLKTV